MGKVVCEECAKPIRYDDAVCIPIMRYGFKGGWLPALLWRIFGDRTDYFDCVNVYCRECGAAKGALHAAFLTLIIIVFAYLGFKASNSGDVAIFVLLPTLLVVIDYFTYKVGERLLKECLEEGPEGNGEA